MATDAEASPCRANKFVLLYNNKDEEIDEIYTDSNYVESCSLNQLYESARRASLRVEDTLDEMLAVLK